MCWLSMIIGRGSIGVRWSLTIQFTESPLKKHQLLADARHARSCLPCLPSCSRTKQNSLDRPRPHTDEKGGRPVLSHSIESYSRGDLLPHHTFSIFSPVKHRSAGPSWHKRIRHPVLHIFPSSATTPHTARQQAPPPPKMPLKALLDRVVAVIQTDHDKAAAAAAAAASQQHHQILLCGEDETATVGRCRLIIANQTNLRASRQTNKQTNKQIPHTGGRRRR